jgi:two-component system OmpR family response regulator
LAVVNILLIEDDTDLAELISVSLGEHGHRTELATDGREALAAAMRRQYDLFIVDRVLPSLDGLSIVKAIRANGVNTPILFLSRKSTVDDRVEGLHAGGDDYLIKPLAVSELLARVNALARRAASAEKGAVTRVGDLEVDFLRRNVSRAGQPIELRPREFQLLEYLIRHSGEVVSRTELLQEVWGANGDSDPDTGIVETYICYLRRKIDKGFDTGLIHTIRGAGYRLSPPPAVAA